MQKSKSISRIADALQNVARTIVDANNDVARDKQIHPTDLRCIVFLDQTGGTASPKEIIAKLGLTSGAGTALLDRLETQGYVVRSRNPDDRRGILISLIKSATRSLIADFAAMNARFEAATEQLSQHELDVISAFLEEIVQVIQMAGSHREDRENDGHGRQSQASEPATGDLDPIPKGAKR